MAVYNFVHITHRINKQLSTLINKIRTAYTQLDVDNRTLVLW